jgi:hypothetical protein
MSDTPRTDAAERKAHGIPDGFGLLPNLHVSGDFARQLERELAKWQAEAARLSAECEHNANMAGMWQTLAERLANSLTFWDVNNSALAAYEAARKA